MAMTMLFSGNVWVRSSRQMMYQYSDHWEPPKLKTSTSKKRKKKSNTVEEENEVEPKDLSKITNTLLHNVVQNVKKDILDKNLHLGVHIIEQSNRVCSTLHVQNYDDHKLLDNKSIPLHSFPISMQDFSEVACTGLNENSTEYAKYCAFYVPLEGSGEYEEADDGERIRSEFGGILDKLPSHLKRASTDPLEKPTFLGFNITESGKDVLKLNAPAIENDPIWLHIQHGGGPFTDFLSNGLRVAMVMSTPFYFICMALQEGSGDINQDIDELPFSNFDEKGFNAMKYKELDLSKIKKNDSAMFLSNGSSHIDSNSFNKLIIRYVKYLLNAAVKDREELSEDVRVSDKELEDDPIHLLSFGQLLQNGTDSLFLILDHKVLEKNTVSLSSRQLASCKCC